MRLGPQMVYIYKVYWFYCCLDTSVRRTEFNRFNLYIAWLHWVLSPPRVAKPPPGLHNVRAPQCVQVCCYAERGPKQQQAPVMSVVAGGGLWVAWTSTRIAMMFVYIRLREPEHGGNPLKQTTFSCHVMYLHEWPSSFSHYVPNIKSYIQSTGTGFVANGAFFLHDVGLRTCFALWNGLTKERQDWKLREEPPSVEVWGCFPTWSGKWWMISWTAGRWIWNCKIYLIAYNHRGGYVYYGGVPK